MKINNNYFVYLIFVVIVSSLIVGLNIAYKRINFELRNKQVELAMSLKEVDVLASLGGLSRRNILKKLKKDGKITSIAVEEDTLDDYVNQGRVTIMKGSEIINLYRVGHVNRYILTNLYKKIKVKPNHFYLFVDVKEDFERIWNYFIIEFGSRNVKEIRKWNILEVLDEEEDLMQVGLGISKRKVEQIQKRGFAVIPRFKNSNRLSARLIRQKFRDLSKLKNINTIIFEGDTVLGYPLNLVTVEEKLKAGDYNVGVIEFQKQRGINNLIKDLPQHVLRVHSISEPVMESISYNKAVLRYLRAAKERGGKILFLHPFFKSQNRGDIIEYNLKFFSLIYEKLNKHNYDIRSIDSLPLNFEKVKNWELLVLSISVVLIVLGLVNCFYALNLFVCVFVYSILGLVFYFCYLFNLFEIWNQYFALLAAIAFPAFAVISQFPKKIEKKVSEKIWLYSLVYLGKIFLITMFGALMVTGLLNQNEYILGINQYFGVKISFIMPLLIIGIYFYLKPHRFSSMVYVLKRVFYAPIRTVSLLAVIFCIVFMFVYILRSGNYLSFQVPLIEHNLRAFLEDILFVRPRTKEFLIGYPLLFLAFIYACKGKDEDWLWFFNALGAVALISIINSFCHFHTPFLISFYRSILGLLLGILVGVIYYLLAKIVKYVFSDKEEVLR
jgi:hypothetical protein